MEEKEKEKDELSIKHKLSQPEGLSVHTHWKTTTYFATKMLSDSKAFVSTQSPKWGLACMLAQLN
jgi:hypothetical protein